jgi:DNA-binding CsgD family transcriptional regulator
MTAHHRRVIVDQKLHSQEEKLYQSLAQTYLRYLGNSKPTHKQLLTMQTLLCQLWVRYTLLFDQRLTLREKACLYQAALGKTIKETARFLGITPMTVSGHRTAILIKLQCHNMVQAVAMGIKYRL